MAVRRPSRPAAGRAFRHVDTKPRLHLGDVLNRTRVHPADLGRTARQAGRVSGSRTGVAGHRDRTDWRPRAYRGRPDRVSAGARRRPLGARRRDVRRRLCDRRRGGSAARVDTHVHNSVLWRVRSCAPRRLPVGGCGSDRLRGDRLAQASGADGGPQLLGHTIFNHVLKTTSATLVSLAILLEVPIAAVLAALWLGQTPPLAALPAAALLLAGIAVVVGSGTTDDAQRSVPVE